MPNKKELKEMMEREHRELAASRLKEVRESSGMNQKDFADFFEVNATTYNRYESGDIGKMPISLIEEISAKFSINPAWLSGFKDAEKYVLPDKAYRKTKRLSVLGSIAAGIPILAQEDLIDYEYVPEDFNATFCLVVKGDSMINARIYDGDLVYIREQPDVENGEVAAVIIDGEEATLKRVYKANGTIILRSENPDPKYKDMVFTGKDKQIKIIGKAVYFRSEVR
jgi:repressor LexA